jgi:DNA primase
MPITWDEVDDRKLTAQRYKIENAITELQRSGDPWTGWRRRAKSLKTARKKLDRLMGS